MAKTWKDSDISIDPIKDQTIAIIGYGKMGKEIEKAARLKGWNILPLICYDLRFPVWSKNTFSKNVYEYDLIVYIANWPKVRSHVWKTLLKARALENLAYVAGVNRVGKDGRMLDHSGDSSVIDYLGTTVAESPPSVEDIITYTLNYEALQKFRSDFSVGYDWDKFEITL